jgi:predicted nucleotidyltransferase
LQLDRDDLIDGLRELVHQTHEQRISGVSIRIVGGAALRLAYFERATTADIDAQIEPIAQITPIIEQIALDRGWPSDWLNNEAVGFIPVWGQTVDWESLFDDENVSISVAPIDALLAMKLNAARPGRDTDDIAKLLVLNGVRSIEVAESIFENFYPGDALPDKATRLLDRIFEVGLPSLPDKPNAPNFDQSL